MDQTWSQEEGRGVNPTELMTKNGEEGVRDAEKTKGSFAYLQRCCLTKRTGPPVIFICLATSPESPTRGGNHPPRGHASSAERPFRFSSHRSALHTACITHGVSRAFHIGVPFFHPKYPEEYAGKRFFSSSSSGDSGLGRLWEMPRATLQEYQSWLWPPIQTEHWKNARL